MNRIVAEIRMSPSKKFWLMMFIGFGIFLAVLLPQTREYRYFENDLHSLLQIRKMPADFFAPWASDDYTARRHPFFYYLTFLERDLFGARPLPSFAVIFIFHFASSILVGALSRKLGAQEGQAAAAGLFFLCSSAFYQALIILSSIDSGMCFVFFMLAVLAWIDFLRTEQLTSLFKAAIFQTLAFFSAEDIVSFPLIALFLAWRLVPQNKNRNHLLVKGMPLLIFFYSASAVFILFRFFMAPCHSEWFEPGKVALFGLKMVNLVKVVLASTFLPARGFLGQNVPAESLLRLIPAGLLFVLLAIFFVRSKQKIFRLERSQAYALVTAAGFGLITALPYMLHPLLFEHTTRYLYFPMAGFSIVFSILAMQIYQAAGAGSVWRRFVFPLLFSGILMLNLLNNANHFRRYKNYALSYGYPIDYTEQVKNILKEDSSRKIYGSR